MNDSQQEVLGGRVIRQLWVPHINRALRRVLCISSLLHQVTHVPIAAITNLTTTLTILGSCHALAVPYKCSLILTKSRGEPSAEVYRQSAVLSLARPVGLFVATDCRWEASSPPSLSCMQKTDQPFGLISAR